MEQKHSSKKEENVPVSKWIIGMIAVAVICAIGAIGLVTMEPDGESKSKTPAKNVSITKIISTPISNQRSKQETMPMAENIAVNLNPTDAVVNGSSNAAATSVYSQGTDVAGGKPFQTPTDQKNNFPAMMASQGFGQDQNSFGNLGDERDTLLEAKPYTPQQSLSEEPAYQERQSSKQPGLTDEKSVAQAPIFQDGAIQSLSVENTGSSDRKVSRLVAKPLAVNPEFEQTAPFTVQAGAFRNHFYAGRYADQLRQRGYLSFIQEIVGLDGQPFYLVCFGHFMTQGETLAAVKEFKTKEDMDAVVASLKSP